MSIESITKKTVETFRDNSPSILAALAVGGVATTGLMSFSAGRRYEKFHEWEKDGLGRPLTGKEKFELGWRPIVPILLVGAGTIACVVGSAAISNRRNAALAGLVTLGEVSLREYKEKVREVVTKAKSEQVDKELAQDKLENSNSKEIAFIGDGDILLFDVLTSRTFRSSKLAIEKAEVEMGRRLLNDMYISLNEWYDEIGLPRIATGDDQGWNHDTPLEIKFIALEKDDKPVLGIDYRFHPVTRFDRIN